MHLTFTCTILKSNTLFVLTSRAVTVLYVALCPGESHCPSTAKDNVLLDSRISSNCSSWFFSQTCLFLDRWNPPCVYSKQISLGISNLRYLQISPSWNTLFLQIPQQLVSVCCHNLSSGVFLVVMTNDMRSL